MNLTYLLFLCCFNFEMSKLGPKNIATIFLHEYKHQISIIYKIISNYQYIIWDSYLVTNLLAETASLEGSRVLFEFIYLIYLYLAEYKISGSLRTEAS